MPKVFPPKGFKTKAINVFMANNSAGASLNQDPAPQTEATAAGPSQPKRQRPEPAPAALPAAPQIEDAGAAVALPAPPLAPSTTEDEIGTLPLLVDGDDDEPMTDAEVMEVLGPMTKEFADIFTPESLAIAERQAAAVHAHETVDLPQRFKDHCATALANAGGKVVDLGEALRRRDECGACRVCVGKLSGRYSNSRCLRLKAHFPLRRNTVAVTMPPIPTWLPQDVAALEMALAGPRGDHSRLEYDRGVLAALLDDCKRRCGWYEMPNHKAVADYFQARVVAAGCGGGHDYTRRIQTKLGRKL